MCVYECLCLSVCVCVCMWGCSIMAWVDVCRYLGKCMGAASPKHTQRHICARTHTHTDTHTFTPYSAQGATKPPHAPVSATLQPVWASPPSRCEHTHAHTHTQNHPQPHPPTHTNTHKQIPPTVRRGLPNVHTHMHQRPFYLCGDNSSLSRLQHIHVCANIPGGLVRVGVCRPLLL